MKAAGFTCVSCVSFNEQSLCSQIIMIQTLHTHPVQRLCQLRDLLGVLYLKHPWRQLRRIRWRNLSPVLFARTYYMTVSGKDVQPEGTLLCLLVRDFAYKQHWLNWLEVVLKWTCFCFSLQPCMHTFCAACYSGWMERSSLCPTCRCPVERIRKNHILNNLVEAYLIQHPGLHK